MTNKMTVQNIHSKIVRLPSRPPAMLARDLANIYEVEAKQIYQAVRRNPDRFPEPDFCFRLTNKEIARLQNEVSLEWPGGSNNPLMFPRMGANQLSSVLKSPVAARRSVQIMRAFSEIEEAAKSGAFAGPAPVPDDASLIPKDRYIELLEAENRLLKTTAAARQRFTDHEKQAVRQMRASGMSASQIAKAINRKTGSVRSLIRRMERQVR